MTNKKDIDRFIHINQSRNVMNLSVNPSERRQINIFDFFDDQVTSEIAIELKQEAQVCLNLFVFTRQDQNKVYTIKVSTSFKNTNASINVFCVAQDCSLINCQLQNQIHAKATGAVVEQNIYGVLLSPKAKIIGQPALVINSSVISASHTLQVGSLNQQHLFYLMRCGISQTQAIYLLILAQMNQVFNVIDSSTNEYAKLLNKWFRIN